jgi:hypothetical protein
MAKIISALTLLLLLPFVTNCTATDSSLQPMPGSVALSRPDRSLVQNITFGVIATMLTVTGVLITYLQYRHIRKFAGEEVMAGLGLELQSGATGIEV